ncbi:MAG: SpoIIE family protein phosphatase, partial [Leptospiraceae bacterium]|nr:SpoIIE family protein phosphatase [Leptospiraceae bacterium]
DPDRIEIVKLIVNLFDSSYLNESFLTSFLILKTMEITLSTGLIPEALISYVNFSVLLSNKRGYEIGKFVVDTINLKNYLHLKSKASHIFCNFINHWTQPLISVNNTRLEGFRAGIESGDIMYSIHNAMWQVWYNFYAGMKFDALSIELEKFLNFVIEHKNKDSELILRSLQNFILDHSNKSVSTRYSKEFYEDCLKSKTKITIICYYLLEIQNYYYLEDYKNAMSIALKVIEVQDSVVGMFTYSEFHYYYTLILIELFTEEEIDKRKIINQQLKMFERYSSNCPENFKHKYYILLAEWARVNEDNLKSIEYYDLSIESADENNFIQDSALLSKLAGKFYLSINKPRFAKIYFKDSIHKFKIWGGEKVANFIINNYLTHYFQNDLNENTTQGTFHSSTTKQVTIDLNSILKASRLLSGEVKLESLLKNLLYLILENAGARKAALVLIIEKEPYIIAEGNTEEKNLYFNNPYPLNISQNIVPATIIRYVYRSKNHLVIDDAGKDENFSHDKYIITNSIHSILCIPVINKGELSALIYLENNLNVGAFTEDRIETIQTLASQFAISLENSLLYNEMEEKVKQRTKELRGALKSVEELKIKQDLDYYLISLLIEPLTNNDYWGEKSKFEYYLNQKKKFSFKNKIHEIGGDINITKPIYLNGEKYTVFLNGDAMGKSSQGAGGVIVLGTALDVIIKRLKENPNLKISPTKWLEGVFKELDNVFKSFDGLMQMSAVIGLLKEETGQIYFINAEQPLSVLIRDKKAEFVEKGSIHNKLGFAFGFEENKKVDIHTLTLEKGDIFLLGSDGRENLFIDGSIDSDSDLFLKLAEEHNGDLNKIVEDITKNGEITDDLSLLKIVRTG